MLDVIMGLYSVLLELIGVIVFSWKVNGRKPQHAAWSILFCLGIMVPATIIINLDPSSGPSTILLIVFFVVFLLYHAIFYSDSLRNTIFKAALASFLAGLSEAPAAIVYLPLGLHLGDSLLADILGPIVSLVAVLALCLSPLQFRKYYITISERQRLILGLDIFYGICLLVPILAWKWNRKLDPVTILFLILLLLFLTVLIISNRKMERENKEYKADKKSDAAVAAVFDDFLNERSLEDPVSVHSPILKLKDLQLATFILGLITELPEPDRIIVDVKATDGQSDIPIYDRQVIIKSLLDKAVSLAPQDLIYVIPDNHEGHFQLTVAAKHDTLSEKDLMQLPHKPKDHCKLQDSLFYAKELLNKYNGEMYILNETIRDTNCICFTVIM